MSLKRELIAYLKEYGKNDTWVNIYEKFPIRGHTITNKQKSDTVRDIYRKKVKKKQNSLKKYLFNTTRPTKPTPKILVFDIENAPLKAYTFRIWKENISPHNGQLRSEWFMLTWSAKWLFDDTIMSDRLTSKEALQEDDSRIVKSIWKLLDEADIVIGHNIVKFDIKTLNTRFIRNGLTPPTPYQTIDTYLHARKHFKFESNSLNYIAKIFGVGKKIDTNFELWKDCIEGKEEALVKMSKYNDQDIIINEDVYLHMRPFISPHPNLNLIIENNVSACPTCMSEDLNWNGKYHTYANTYDSFTCNSCGSVGRSRKNSTSKKTKKALTISTPKS